MENTINTAPKDIRSVPLEEEISRRAHEIWEITGKPDGRSDEFWLQAEREVLGAETAIRIDSAGAVSAKQYTQATDANAAKSKSRTRR